MRYRKKCIELTVEEQFKHIELSVEELFAHIGQLVVEQLEQSEHIGQFVVEQREQIELRGLKKPKGLATRLRQSIELAKQVGGRSIFEQLGIQLSPRVSLEGCTQCICLDRPKECIQFDIRWRSSR